MERESLLTLCDCIVRDELDEFIDAAAEAGA